MDILKNKYSSITPEHFYCDNGWYDLIYSVLDVCDNYTHTNQKLKNFKFTQIKEKFGGIRMYCENSDDFIDGTIRLAESISYKICEITGKPGYLCTNKRIIKTLCKEEAEKLGFEKYL